MTCKHGSSLVVQWLRLRVSSIGSTGSVPGQGALKKKKKKKKEEEFILSFNKTILITEIKNRHYNTDKSDDIKRKCLVLM